MIGGLIVLTLLLTALGTMVFVSQLNDQYQQSVSNMVQYDSQRSAENLVSNFPGLTLVDGVAVPGWGTCTSTTYNCYSMSLSNLGGVGVQIVRIYINSTGSGCTTLCVLSPTVTITQYAFNQANSFLNPGEVNHVLLLALPNSVMLPGANMVMSSFPYNTILAATARGNVFSFQWPFQVPVYASTNAAFSSGTLKVAYQSLTASSTCVQSGGGYGGGTYTGCDSKNEPGVVAGGSGGTVGTGYCHNEALEPYPAASNYAEALTGISGLHSGTTLYFVNPWITETVFASAVNIINGGPPRTPQTQIYVYEVVTNTFNYSYTVNNGTIDLTWYSTDHIDGVLYGLYYNYQFYRTGSLPSIPPGASYYAIYILNQMELYFPQPNGSINSVMFWGGASLSTTAKDQTYFSGTLLSSGLWIRYSC